VAIDFHAILPELVLAGTALLVLVVDLFVERAKVVASWLSIAGTVVAGVALASLVGGGRMSPAAASVVELLGTPGDL
jgi:NADH:ubiquinone oxidoreductase subunit 2 (subunit N)